MATDGEVEQNALLRGILASVVAGTGTELPQGAGGDVAQLIAAAMTQLGQNIVNLHVGGGLDETQNTMGTESELSAGTNVQSEDIQFNPEVAGLEEEQVGVASSQDEEKPAKAKPICVKLSIEKRKRIIALRKEGKKCKEISKEVGVSVSGAEKVWERFLATGKVHDRKPSEYAGRPRKSVTFSQGSDSSSPLVSKTHHIQVGETVDVSHSDNEHAIEYDADSGAIGDPPAANTEDTVVISEDGDIYVEGPLDVPGATVEIVESEPIPVATPTQKRTPAKKKTEYREHLLLKLIEGCPLAALREDKIIDNQKNPHIANLSASIDRPLYMESILGHPFGRVPPSKPFDANMKEAEVILSDPMEPVGKDLIAALGYSTKVYFNACCKPSPLFDSNEVISSLPFSYEAGHLAESTQKVLQLFVNLCKDPLAALQRIPEGDGPVIIAQSPSGVLTRRCQAPESLSEYWVRIYKYAELFECCENFLSASIPSAPCLLCHPFQKLAQTLEIRDQDEADFSPPLSLHSSSSSTSANVAVSHTIDSLTHHVEIQVLESGQVARSSATFLSTESTPPILARNTVASSRVRGTASTECHVEPMTASSTPHSKRGRPLLATPVQRRAANNSGSSAVGGSGAGAGAGKATQPEDQVEVDGQFDMPILGSGTVSTGASAMMTFVMTSEDLSQTTSPSVMANITPGNGHIKCSSNSPAKKQHQTSSPVPSGVKSVGLQIQHTPTSLSGKPPPSQVTPIAPPTPAAVATTGKEQTNLRERESADAATQTTSAQVRPEVEDRTPLIIRRSRAGRVQKAANAKQQSDTDVKLVEPKGNETSQPSGKEVQIQTQLLSVVGLSSVGVQATEVITKEPGSTDNEKAPNQTPRRSTRKSVHKVSPEKNESIVGTVTPPPAKTSRISPATKSPAKTSPTASNAAQNSPRMRTRSAAKRCGQDKEQSSEGRDTPPAKRSRKATTIERPGGKHPQFWGVNEVAEFINGFQSDCTNTFREHEVDGESLFTLDPEMMVKLMNLKTGPALKIHRKVAALKKQHGTLNIN